MEAITRKEKIMSGENLTPITRREMFLAKAAGQDVETPEPITREEIFLSKISGGGGGGGSSDLLSQIIARTATEISDDSVTSIGDSAFRYYTDLKRASFPNAITVGMYAFAGCENLESIDLPSATSIGDYAFDGDVPMLLELCLPSAISIGESAFIGCQGLMSVDLHCVTSIGNRAFYNSWGITSATIRTPSVCTLGTDVFDEMAIGGGFLIYVPANLVDSYKAATNWSNYADIIVPIEE